MTTTTEPAGHPGQAQPGRGGGRRRRRVEETGRTRASRTSRTEPVSLDPEATTGPVSAVLALLVGALELFGALSSWLGPSDG
ncbi:hypothetical protein FHN55_06140 [Streptomyces sp. NP160]|uniref:hypothetical protein n=1 Tax=Streptomyces sp. NP160 TaxID=2586637 RepID=UPI0011197F55|nr:hypothetical protein [Streptomyces sp. NP160]TNM68782.1 hypothetical protein FHN55_06140 [Streptomyces sp. NP160]